jgi:hypothetical protein
MSIQIQSHTKPFSGIRSKWFMSALVLGVAVLSISMAGCSKSGQSSTQYTCPMHPEVVDSKPGKCPKCNMDLVEKK